jgi:hypothetical protein
MTAVLDDPFAEEIERRDRWGRPLLVPPGGGERQPYTRMSTMSGYLCDKSALETWTRQKLAIGLSRREDLCALIASLPVIHDCFTDKSLLTKEQKKSDVETKARLAEYMEAAMEAGDRLYKANWGTAIHAFIERGVWDSAPQRMIADVQAALKMFADHKLEVLATERFVVNDALQAAGTFDYLVRHPKYGCVIADVKTGQMDGHGLEFGVQFSGYAGGVLYDWKTDERTPLESLTGGEPVNQDVGLLIHVPLGQARTALYPINLVRGRQAAQLAVQVREERSYKEFIGPELVAS